MSWPRPNRYSVENGAVGYGLLSTNAFTIRQELSRFELIRLYPADGGEGRAQLIEGSDQHEIDGIGGQSVGRDGEARHVTALHDLETHAHGVRQDDVGADEIRRHQREVDRQLLIGEVEDDEHDQPDADGTDGENGDALQRADQQSHLSPPPSVAAALLDKALRRAVGRIDEYHVLWIAARRVDRQKDERLFEDIGQRVHGTALEMQNSPGPNSALRDASPIQNVPRPEKT